MSGRWMESLEGRRVLSGALPVYAAAAPAKLLPALTLREPLPTSDAFLVATYNGSPGAYTLYFLPRELSQSSLGAVSLSPKGTLLLQGSNGDDTFEAVKSGTSIEVLMRSARDGTGVVAVYPADKVRSIVVQGGGGHDLLRVDPSTQPLTSDVNVEDRLLDLPNHHQVRDIPSTPMPGQYSSQESTWIARSARQIATQPRAKATVALLGDSMLNYFAETGAQSYARAFGPNAVDLGLPGDTTSQLLYRIENQGLLDKMAPALVVLDIGTNNASLSADAAATIRGVAAVLAAIRQRLPQARVLVLGLLPQHRKPQDATIAAINAGLEQLADGTTTFFFSAAAAFVSPNALARYYRPGNIHLNFHGYARWATLLAPVVRALR